ncbi:unnamed protein product, partial [Staurois parvus]
GNAVGSFSLIDDAVSQLLTCGTVQDSAVSQTSKRKKSMVEVYWIAPSNAPQHVQFLVTVVAKYSIYWGPGENSRTSCFSNYSSTCPTDFNYCCITSANQVSSNTAVQRASGCGRSKFCVRNPTSCDPERDTQCFFLSFQKKSNSMQIELSGPGKGYVSFALSHDQWMGDDDYYLCVIEMTRQLM